MPRYYFVPERFRKAFPQAQRLIWWLEAAVISLGLSLLRLLPLRAALRLSGAVFARVGPRVPRADKVRLNLRVAFPRKNKAEIEQLVRAMFCHLGTAMAELMHMQKIWRERGQRIDFLVHPDATRPRPENSMVFVTAHVGAWQLTTLIAPYFGLTMPLIYAPEENPYMERKLASLRSAFGGPMVARDGGIRVLVRSLDQGDSIGLTMDTRMDAGELIPFFGEDASTNTIPARLALRYGVDLVPVYAERLSNARFRVHICPPVRPRDPQATAAEQARDMSCQVNALFESWIEQMPGQWLCLKRRWPKSVYRRVSVYQSSVAPS